MRGAGLIWAIGVLRPLELHLQPLHADLEAVHGLDGSLGTAWIIEAHKAYVRNDRNGGRERGRERKGEREGERERK